MSVIELLSNFYSSSTPPFLQYVKTTSRTGSLDRFFGTRNLLGMSCLQGTRHREKKFDDLPSSSSCQRTQLEDRPQTQIHYLFLFLPSQGQTRIHFIQVMQSSSNSSYLPFQVEIDKFGINKHWPDINKRQLIARRKLR